LQALKEFVETRSGQRRGSESARYITKGELDQGLGVDITSQTLDLSSQIPSTEIPDPPTDMTVENRMWSNLLSWTNPESASVSHIEVWAAEDSQSRDNAILIGYETVHDPQRGARAEWMHSALNVRMSYTYWIRSVTHSGVYSVWCPPDAQGGYVVEASMSVSMKEVMADLTGSITENELATDLSSRIDLIDTDAPFFAPGVFEAGVISPLGWYISDMGVVTTSQAAEMQLASDRFTVKIQKDENGRFYASGFGLIVHPQWRADGVYESGKTVYNNGGSYSSKIDNNTGHEPTGEDAYWAVVDDEEAPESEFIIQADKLMVIEPGETPKAMLTLGTVDGVNTLAINGALIADEGIQTRMLAAGLVTADKVSAEDVFTMNLQSGNYSSGSSGFKIDAINGTAEFNNISLRISNPATVRADLDVEEGATNDSNIYYPGTTYINGGNIYTGTITADTYKELRNTIVYNETDSLDDSADFEMPFKVVEELRTVISVKLSFKRTSYRAYAKNVEAAAATTSGASSTMTTSTSGAALKTSTIQCTSYSWETSCVKWSSPSPMTGTTITTSWGFLHTCPADGDLGNHCHCLPSSCLCNHCHAVSTSCMNHSHPLPDHYHETCIEGHSHTMCHTHSVPAHNHDITHGIFEYLPSPLPTITVKVNNGAGLITVGTYTGAEYTDIDITSYIYGAGWKSVVFSATDLCRVHCVVELKLDIDA
jgi:hypothetical protein